MDSPDRNKDTPPKAKSAGGPPPASAAHSKAKRDQRAQMSASIWALRGGQIPELLSQDPSMAIEREKSDSRLPLKRDRSGDFFDSPAINGASYSDGEEEPPRKRRLVKPAVPGVPVTTKGRVEYFGHSDEPNDTAPFVIYSDDDRPQSTSSLSYDDMDDLKAKLHKRGRVGIIHDPEKAVAWIEKNWEIPLLTSIRKHGYDGPFAQMLFMEKPALALFGSRADEFLRDSAEELGKLSNLPVVIRPSSDAPKGVLALPVARESSPGGSSVICYPDLSSHDGQRGATGMDVASEHRTRLALRMKTHNSHVHAVDIRSNFKFHIDRDTNLAASRASLDHPSFESEVIALVDLQIETGLQEIQVDRSYVSIGFLAHREESMMNCEFLHRDFDLSEKHRISTTLGFPAVEASHRKIMPKQGDMWDEDSKSYRSYNIAYEPQHMRLNPRRSEAHPLEVKVGMGINLQPPGSEKPLPQISFIHRNQILIWVPDPASKARVRGIVVSMSNYLDDIRKEGQVITEPHDLHLMNAGTPYPGQAKKKERRPDTISLTVRSRILLAATLKPIIATFGRQYLKRKRLPSKRANKNEIGRRGKGQRVVPDANENVM